MKWPPPIPIPSALEDSQQFIDGTPESFICSITLRVMKEPALSVKSGRTYEREALQEWVSGRGTDPLNPSARMSVDDIAPNFAIRDLIEQHVKDSALRFLMMTSNERNDNSNDSNNNNNNNNKNNNNTAAINNGVRTFHVRRENWKANEFPGIKIFNEEKDWCPLCNGRTVVREGGYSRLLSFSHNFLWNETKELLESTRGGIKVETEDFRDILLSYFQRNLHGGSCCVTGITDFNSFQRKDGHICYHCLQNAKNHFSSPELD